MIQTAWSCICRYTSRSSNTTPTTVRKSNMCFSLVFPLKIFCGRHWRQLRNNRYMKQKTFFCRCFEQLIGRKKYKPLHICAVIQSVKWTAFTGTNSPDAPFGNSRIHLKQRTILLRHKVVQEWRPFNPWWHFTALFFWYMCVPARSLSLCRNWMCTSLGECNMAHAKRR